LLTKRHLSAAGRAAPALLTLSMLLLSASLAIRIVRGHGWPFQSPADMATGIALLLLVFYLGWSAFTHQQAAIGLTSAIALALLSYALIRQPPTLSTQPFPSLGMRVGILLNLCGGAFLALGAAASLSSLLARRLARPGERDANEPTDDLASEVFVRIALFCLALSLAIDTWWLQKVGLGNIDDAQQAGIAVVWMVYFGAIRLRAQPDWRGWPWTAIVTVGFACTLPILLNVPWLEMTLSL
jgi:hypothetical protein